MEKLCQKYTSLSTADIAKLQQLETTLAYYAELAECYMFIDCMVDKQSHAIVVAEAFPKKHNHLYEQSVIGKIVFESFEPAVFSAFRKGEKASVSRAITQEGITVEQHVIPIFNDDGQVIAVLIKENRMEVKEQNNEVVQQMPFALIEHIVKPDFQPVPVVSDLLVESIILTNHENKVIYTNPAGYRFISELSGRDSFDNIAIDEVFPFLQEVYDEDDDVFFLEITVDGKSFIVKKIPIRNQSNKVTLLIIHDLTELKLKENELMMKTFAIREIHHRVKNNLQTVTSLLRLQMRNVASTSQKAAFQEALNRIYSISSVYELILENADNAEEKVDVIALAKKISNKMMNTASTTDIQLTIQHDNLQLFCHSKKAVSLALIICELLQNALKYAFTGRQEGLITLHFCQENSMISLHISDNGVGMHEAKPSLGMEIVMRLVEYDLAGTFTIIPSDRGTHTQIQFPVCEEVFILND
ncbi:histidine kinase N-terminal domain-containing protein [Metasolibacillus meyeri]|uniref:histidine kinase n=1 Tax=Metasolibacillus meyeri TaxID=1071052 RepID=A0AAW9NVK0_9BACL|nr:histidine kinase N-terminal domain-containing protein [Metasolibacillus meyeri]MEC1179900.1 histidine kinase N-terminal domain-containing protein [Metasolibacillus meyeri]